jgi:nitroreductase
MTLDTLNNVVLDRIIYARRACRKFSHDVPNITNIESIIDAGLHSPFSNTIDTTQEYFRKFFVIRNNSLIMNKISSLLLAKTEALIEVIGSDEICNKDPNAQKMTSPYLDQLKEYEKQGYVNGVGNAPYLIIVAEKKYFPPVQQESIAYCISNMWLKATALGLGFHPITMLSRLDHTEVFYKLLGMSELDHFNWTFNGCAIGYSLENLPTSERPNIENITKWFE